MSHEDFMRRALEQAALARDAGEVPVGAVVVLEGLIIAASFNQPITSNDPTAHAEIVAMRAAAAAVGNYRLTGATVYVTVEPCLMCVGAMVHARIGQVVFGAPEPKAGAIQSMTSAHQLPGLNHRLEALGGVLEAECREIIQAFFRGRRAEGSIEQLAMSLITPLNRGVGPGLRQLSLEYISLTGEELPADRTPGVLSALVGRYAIRKDDVQVFDTLVTTLAAVAGDVVFGSEPLPKTIMTVATTLFRLVNTLRANSAMLDADGLRVLTILHANVRGPADPGMTAEDIHEVILRTEPGATFNWVTAQLSRLASWPVQSGAMKGLASAGADRRWRPHV